MSRTAVDLNKAAGAFLAEQWYISQADYDAVMAVNGLPTNVGSLRASKEQMDELAGSLDELGEGAGIAVKNAGKVVDFAETTHKVLTTVEMAGGVTTLVRTGATLLVKEGLKACAKQAAKELMQEAASGVAAGMANYAAELAGVPEEHRQYIAIGVDAYQTFSFLKAAKVKLNPNGNCFVAGTQVLAGVDADGIFRTENIEDIQIGDVVLSRDQADAGDDLDPRRVTQVFRKTSDHIRVLTFRDADGNVETIRTTDDHPFYVGGNGWMEADELSIGTRVSEADGTDVVLISSTHESHPQGITVFNFEVEGDHTYFVEDGTGGQSPVWAHNMCVGDRFVARMSTKGVYFNGVNVTTQRFRKVADTSALQAAAGPEKNRFVQDLGMRAQSDPALAQQLTVAGVHPSEFSTMASSGKRPRGFEVHHKTPLEWGGDNSQGNFILMKNQPYHRAITQEQGELGGSFGPDEEFELAWPEFNGVIYNWNGG